MILLVPDVKGWAWWWMFKGIADWCGGCELADPQDWHRLTESDRQGKFARRYECILQASWTEYCYVPGKHRTATLLASHGAEYPFPSSGSSLPAKIATELRNRGKASLQLPEIDVVLCQTQSLVDVAHSLGANGVLSTPGVDHTVFVPAALPNRQRLRVGWCGQRDGVTKGYKEVLRPLMEDDRFDWVVNTRHQGNALTQKQMVKWHQSIDVYLSTSCSEGFGMPRLEAMACGRPVITTRTGGWDAIEPGVNGALVPSYDTEAECPAVIEHIKSALMAFHSNRDTLAACGANARKTVEDRYTWKQRAPEWVELMR